MSHAHIHFSDSKYTTNFLEPAVANKAYKNLQQEIQYVPRQNLTFTIYGKTFPLPRDKAFYGDVDADGSYPLYRYGGKDYPPVQQWTPTLQKLRDLIHEKTGHFCNHVVVNKYVNGNDHIGLHKDKTRDFVNDAAVCTLSFGGTRILRLKHDQTGVNKDFDLEHNSLFILGSETNANYKHSIVKTSQDCDIRVSLTFRNIATRADRQGKVL
ncbi:hypothetical protein HK097_008983 [Rhizophlyctis rosea]|uniref:Fe2OG dioxygenase domain-containing protein n=1 Tax=Rhizophlyctis rosea TaxID=64517 RepID=A0AAD5SHN5_9FUNG|nr:hypothetical protein HK097_008983 [Rhizophlyctis rosea]